MNPREPNSLHKTVQIIIGYVGNYLKIHAPDILPDNQEGEELMATTVRCPECLKYNERTKPSEEYWHEPRIQLRCYRFGLTDAAVYHHVILEGIITCTYDGHRRPIKLVDDAIDDTSPELGVNESSRLNQNVPDLIKEDVREAEKCHFAQAYKGSVVICRRALQMAFEDRLGVTGKTLGPLLDTARKCTPKLLDPRTEVLADGVKDYGDSGAHRTESFAPEQAAVVIHAAVEVLNALYP